MAYQTRSGYQIQSKSSHLRNDLMPPGAVRAPIGHRAGLHIQRLSVSCRGVYMPVLGGVRVCVPVLNGRNHPLLRNPVHVVRLVMPLG